MQNQAQCFKDYICDTSKLLRDAAKNNKNILFEAQLGALRDIDYGIYPYTSSSNTLAAYIPMGTGLMGYNVSQVIGVMKAYSTCVGEGWLCCREGYAGKLDGRVKKSWR